jgi:alcohol dehydrogenase, propanol-preferring
VRAWLFTSTDTPLQLTELPDPEPGKHEVVVDVRASGLCHSDVSFMDGTITGLLGRLPIVLGHEIVGEVSAVGAGVADLEPGARVAVPATTASPGTATDGGFAERVLVRREHLVVLPDGTDFEQAAPASCAGKTSYQAIHTVGQVGPGMNVGVIGFGGLGSIATQIAVTAGADVYVAEINDTLRDAALEAGAAGFGPDIREFAERGLDVVVDFAGMGVTTASAIEAAREGGRVVQVGLAREHATISAQALTMKGLQLVGAANAGIPETVGILDLIAEGKVRTSVEVIGFDEIPQGLARLEAGKAQRRLVAVF